MLIDDAKVMEEILALKATCGSIEYDLERGIVLLEEFPFPNGWTPRSGAILYNLPPTYRAVQPRAFMPAHMSYRESKPMIMLMHRDPPNGFEPTAWAEHCIHKLHNWNPARHTMVTMTRLINDSLKRPNSQDPWT